MTLKVGTIHHQLKYKDDEDELQNDDVITGEETPMLAEKLATKPGRFAVVTEVPFTKIIMQKIIH